VFYFKVRVGGREAEFEDESVEFVEDEDEREVFGYCVPDERFGADHETFDDVDDEDDAVCEAHGGGGFVDKVEVAGGVEEVEEVGFAAGGGEDEGEGVGFEGDLARGGEGVGVGVAELSPATE
jgi:hypothetical protein